MWPGQDGRAARLRAAIAIARRDLPQVVRGDLLTDLEPLIAAAPFAIEVRPVNAARSTSNPAWTGQGSISSYNPVAGGVGEEQLAAVTIEAAGSLTRLTS